MSAIKAGKVIELNAVMFPPCSECGAPYKPSKPIEDHGTILFQSQDALANMLFRVERFVKTLRQRRMRSL